MINTQSQLRYLTFHGGINLKFRIKHELVFIITVLVYKRDFPAVCYLLMVYFLPDMDFSLPDEILCHGGGLLFSDEESGHSGEDREESVGLQSSNGGFW